MGNAASGPSKEAVVAAAKTRSAYMPPLGPPNPVSQPAIAALPLLQGVHWHRLAPGLAGSQGPMLTTVAHFLKAEII